MNQTISKPSFQKSETWGRVFLELKQEVHDKVGRLEPGRRQLITLKAIFFPLAYFGTYLIALLYGSSETVLYSCYFLLGIFLVLNFLNLIHEAVHQTLFKRKWLNNGYVYLLDLMGANSFIWKIRHTRLHHNYPNVMGWDSDFEQSAVARVFPTGTFSLIHKYQHLYLPVMYPFYLLNWLLVRDFIDFFGNNRLVRKVTSIDKVEYLKLFVFKGFFIFYTVFMPVLVLDVSMYTAITAFLILIFTASILSLLVLLSPHANVFNEFPEAGDDGALPYPWFMHQFVTTNDVKEDNWFTRYFMGCFNFHIAHHLFPNVNHVYYPEVTDIIKRFADKHQLPYKQFSLTTSLRNHYALLKANASVENIFEETM